MLQNESQIPCLSNVVFSEVNAFIHMSASGEQWGAKRDVFIGTIGLVIHLAPEGGHVTRNVGILWLPE
jgi:hypothetical protein